MVNLLAHCDESGKEHEHDIVTFVALVSGYQAWNEFSHKWSKLLRDKGLTYFHSTKAFRYSQRYGDMIPGAPEQRSDDIRPFLKCILENIELGSIAAINARDWKLASLHDLRRKFGDDPHYFAFFYALAHALGHFSNPRNSRIGLVLDDDEGKAREVYGFFVRVKKEDPEVKLRVPSICFVDDEMYTQLQAADLFGYLCRLHGERKLLNKPNPYAELSELIDAPEWHLTLCGGYIGEAFLKTYLQDQRLKKRTP